MGTPHEHPNTVVETVFIPASDDASIRLHLRNRRPAATTEDTFPSDRVVLFVHGATYPAETGFDLPLPGGSWMSYVAERGFDAWCLDVRGYGRSSRPAAMHEPAEQNPPVCDTADAIRDIGAAVDFILNKRGLKQLVLVGWSWGTSTTAGFTAKNGDKVHKLVLYAPLWTLEGGASSSPIAGTGAWRTVEEAGARTRAYAGIPKDRHEEIWPAKWFNEWWAGNLATDPIGSIMSPPVMRTPNGVVRDVIEHWAQGNPLYDPAEIKVPTLVVVAEWDKDTPPRMAHDVHAKLVNAPTRELVVLKEGTHSIVLETRRMSLLETVQKFLETKH